MSSHQFGHTWWGRAWVRALEERAALDPNRLPRGRTYARQDRVTSLTVEPGSVSASVRGSRRLSYRTHIAVRTYDDDEWAAVVDAIGSRSGHLAAILDGELDPEVVDDARAAGVELLPTKGDLRPRCSCPDAASTCKHAAAVAYLVAEALDDDPFLLFALRGRTRTALLDELRAHRRQDRPMAEGTDDGPEARAAGLAVGRAAGSGPDPGEPARRAWNRQRGPLPTLPELPTTPGTPAAWPEDPPPDAPFDPPGLLVLANDAARRAWAQLRGDATSALSLDHEADRARREATGPAALLARPGADAGTSAEGGTEPGDLTYRAVAWRHGGEAALAMLGESPWRPPVATMAAARSAITDAGVSPSVLTISNNRITGPGFQLRLSRSGSWWRFEKRKNRWEVAASPADGPDDLLDPG